MLNYFFLGNVNVHYDGEKLIHQFDQIPLVHGPERFLSLETLRALHVHAHVPSLHG